MALQEVSGAHINVSRNIPKSTERLITIKVRHCSWEGREGGGGRGREEERHSSWAAGGEGGRGRERDTGLGAERGRWEGERERERHRSWAGRAGETGGNAYIHCVVVMSTL